jgi:RHS repeat-associated protein
MTLQHLAPDVTSVLSCGLGSGIQRIFTRGEKLFELSNHLGNVLATVSDKRIQHSTDTTVSYYTADVMSANDYYPFGMQMPGRKYAGNNSYRFGFNGKENDNDVKGEGNQQDYGMRIYDPRIGKFLSLDPLQAKFPFYSPYHFAGNTPVQAIDLDGTEEFHYTLTMDHGEPKLKHTGTVTQDSYFWGLYKEKIGSERYVIQYGDKTYKFTLSGIGNQGQTNDQLFDYLDNPQNYDEEFSHYFYSENFVKWQNRFEGMAYGVTTGAMLNAGARKTVGRTNVGEGTTSSTNNQATAANSGNSEAALSNTGFNRPSWQQTEADVVTSDYRQQVAFKNGNEVPMRTKGSTRPEGYKPGESIEAKNYTLTNEAGIRSMIRNVTKQVKQRIANLPANTVQNIVLDVRGQNITTQQLMTIRSRLMTQTGSKNINVTFKSN